MTPCYHLVVMVSSCETLTQSLLTSWSIAWQTSARCISLAKAKKYDWNFPRFLIVNSMPIYFILVIKKGIIKYYVCKFESSFIQFLNLTQMHHFYLLSRKLMERLEVKVSICYIHYSISSNHWLYLSRYNLSLNNWFFR